MYKKEKLSKDPRTLASAEFASGELKSEPAPERGLRIPKYLWVHAGPRGGWAASQARLRPGRRGPAAGRGAAPQAGSLPGPRGRAGRRRLGAGARCAASSRPGSERPAGRGRGPSGPGGGSPGPPRRATVTQAARGAGRLAAAPLLSRCGGAEHRSVPAPGGPTAFDRAQGGRRGSNAGVFPAGSGRGWSVLRRGGESQRGGGRGSAEGTLRASAKQRERPCGARAGCALGTPGPLLLPAPPAGNEAQEPQTRCSQPSEAEMDRNSECN